MKAPKIYIRDSGLLHTILRVPTHQDLAGHAKYGASWEGFVVEQVLAALEEREAYFWATHSGAELDLMVIRRGKRFGFEMKCADAPGMTRSLQSALDDLGLEHAWIIYPGSSAYRVHDRVTVAPIASLPELMGALP